MVWQEAPWFLDRVAQAQRNRQAITLSLWLFEDNPLLLYACLWYASFEGVTVQVVPMPHRETSISPQKTTL